MTANFILTIEHNECALPKVSSGCLHGFVSFYIRVGSSNTNTDIIRNKNANWRWAIQNKLSVLHQHARSFCYDQKKNTNSQFYSFSWEQNFFRIENPTTSSWVNGILNFLDFTHEKKKTTQKQWTYGVVNVQYHHFPPLDRNELVVVT